MIMTHDKTSKEEISDKELEALDANLLEIELLYKSRCVAPPKGTNVTVREIEKPEK